MLSWRPTDDVLLYASYSHGYKAGGFNLDRSALGQPISRRPSAPPRRSHPALVGNLQFDPEIVNAYELGAKYFAGPVTLNVTAFRQMFRTSS